MPGINGFTGNVFKNFTRADTLPFSFTFKTEEEVAIDVAGWKVYLSFSLNKASATPDLEVELLPTDATNGIISGEVSDDDTYSLRAHSYYASARYVSDSGMTRIIDMARIKVYDSVTSRRD